MIKLTYTEEMKKQDKLWQTESEDLELMDKLYNQIVKEAKGKGFKGVVEIYEANGEMVSEVYESKEEQRLVEDGKLDLHGENMSGYCKPLIEKIEEIMSR